MENKLLCTSFHNLKEEMETPVGTKDSKDIRQILRALSNENNSEEITEYNNQLRQMYPLLKCDDKSLYQAVGLNYENNKIDYRPWDEENITNTRINSSDNNNNNNNNNNNVNNNITNSDNNNENDLNNEKKTLKNKIKSRLFKKSKSNLNSNNNKNGRLLKTIDDPIIIFPFGGMSGKSPFIFRFLYDVYMNVLFYLIDNLFYLIN